MLLFYVLNMGTLRMNAHTLLYAFRMVDCMHIWICWIEFEMDIQIQYSIWCAYFIFFVYKSFIKATKREFNGKGYDIC